MARRLSARRSSSLKPPQNTVILIGVKRALQARVNHLAGAADGLGLFDLLIGGACIADQGKNSSGSLSRHAALARQSKALLI